MEVKRVRLNLGTLRVSIRRTFESTADLIEIESQDPFGLSLVIHAKRIEVVDTRPKPARTSDAPKEV